jgi:hypothetical protein
MQEQKKKARANRMTTTARTVQRTQESYSLLVPVSNQTKDLTTLWGLSWAMELIAAY